MIKMKVRTMLLLLATILPLCLGCKKELNYEGKPHSYWKEQAKDASPEFRLKAVAALLHLEDSRTLVELLSDNNPSVQAAAVVALEQIGEPAIPSYYRIAANANEPKVRVAAFLLLVHVGEPAIPALSKLAHEGNAEAARRPPLFCRQVGEPTIPALSKLAHEGNTKCKRPPSMLCGK